MTALFSRLSSIGILKLSFSACENTLIWTFSTRLLFLNPGVLGDCTPLFSMILSHMCLNGKPSLEAHKFSMSHYGRVVRQDR